MKGLDFFYIRIQDGSKELSENNFSMATFGTQIYKTFNVRLCDDFPCDIISNSRKKSCVQEVFYLITNCLQGTRDLSRRGNILGTLSTRWLEPLSFTAISEQTRTSSQ
jgi:hypothetical protein